MRIPRAAAATTTTITQPLRSATTFLLGRRPTPLGRRAMSANGRDPAASTPAHPEKSTSTAPPTAGAQPLPLPQPASSSSEGRSEGTLTLDVSGEGSSTRLDHLGPLVVNRDGSMARVSNWAEMAQVERENTLRILGKRNQLRLDALKKAKGNGDGQAE